MKIKYEVISVDTTKHKLYKYDFVHVQFSFTKWSWSKFWWKNQWTTAIYFTKDRAEFSNVHTGRYPAVDLYKIFNASLDQGREFESWLHGEFNYRIITRNTVSSQAAVLENLIGKIFKCSKDTNLTDIDGGIHPIKKDTCLTLVGNSFISDKRNIESGLTVLYNDKKIHIKVLPCESFEMI